MHSYSPLWEAVSVLRQFALDLVRSLAQSPFVMITLSTLLVSHFRRISSRCSHFRLLSSFAALPSGILRPQYLFLLRIHRS